MSRIYKIDIDFLKNIRERLKTNRSILILTIFLILGTVLGSITAGTPSNPRDISELFSQYIVSKEGQALSSAFFGSFISFFPYLLVSFLLGHTAFGHYISWTVPFFRGLGIGAVTGYLYINCGVAGMAYCALIFAPPAIISSLIIILSCNRANKLSKQICKMYRKGTRCLSLNSDIYEYCTKHFKYLLIIFLNSAFGALLNTVFYKLFDL